MYRYATILIMLALAAWGGVRFERFRLADLCLDAGGAVDDRGLCKGAGS